MTEHLIYGTITVYLLITALFVGIKIVLPRMVEFSRRNDPDWDDEDEYHAARAERTPVWFLFIWPVTVPLALIKNARNNQE